MLFQGAVFFGSLRISIKSLHVGPSETDSIPDDLDLATFELVPVNSPSEHERVNTDSGVPTWFTLNISQFRHVGIAETYAVVFETALGRYSICSESYVLTTIAVA